MPKILAQTEAKAFDNAQRLCENSDTKAVGLERIIALALEAITPGIRRWARTYLAERFSVIVGDDDATESKTGSVSR